MPTADKWPLTEWFELWRFVEEEF